MAVGRVKALALAAVVSLAAAPARAHVAPSPEANNRYLKATLLPDGVRLSYTVIFGDRPGSAERRRMDENGDGRLDAAESAGFGARLLAVLAPRLAITLDGRPLAGWRVADVGLGEPTVAGAAISVDLVLRAPYPDARAAEHRLAIADRTEIPLPGEVEIRVDESPGVRVLESHLPEAGAGIELRFPFTGNGEHAIVARFTVAEELRPRRSRGVILAVVGGVVAALLAAAAWRRRRKPETGDRRPETGD
jgi:hypothetical protein